MNPLDPKTIALNGGVQLAILLTEGREENVIVRQLPLADYERAFNVLADEIAFVGLLCGKDKKWALQLTPASYEQIHTLGKEVNEKGFFVFAGRRTESLAAQTGAMLAMLPPETVKLALQTSGFTTSPTASPTSPSPRR